MTELQKAALEAIKLLQGALGSGMNPEKNWLIRKEPNTRDNYYVAEGNPPAHVLEVYGIVAKT